MFHVRFLTFILTLTVIGFLFLCYNFKCYSFIYFKLTKFYQRTRTQKRKLKTNDAVVFKNQHNPKDPQASVVAVANLEAILRDLNERNKVRSSRNQPNPVLRSKSTS